MSEQIRSASGGTNQKKPPLCVLIHGVGYVDPGKNLKAVRALTKRFWPDVKVEEFCWSQHVPRPMQELDGTVGLDYFLRLGRAIRNAAWLGHSVSAQGGVSKKALQSLSNLAARLFTVLATALVVVATAGSVAWSGTRIGASADPVWGFEGKRIPLLLELIEWYLAPLPFLPAFGTAACWVLVGLGCSAALAMVSTTIARGFPGLLEESRRLVLVALWPLVCILAALSIYPMVVLLCGVGIVAVYVLRRWSTTLALILGDYGSLWPALLTIAVSITVLFGLRLASGFFGYRLKPLADVFLYIGDSQYRRDLLAKLSQLLRQVDSSGRQVVVVGHSLGSVVATDALRAESALDSLLLVTMGSPITRLFRRFFPSQVPSVRRRLYELRAKHHDFFWANVYRPLDWIGGPLGGGGDGFADASTRQWRGPFASHRRYWSDAEVAETLEVVLAERLADPGLVDRQPSLAEREVKRPGPSWSEPQPPRLLAAATTIALVLVAPAWCIVRDHIVYPSVDREAIALRYAELERGGRSAVATVTPRIREVRDRSADGLLRYARSFRVGLDWEHRREEYSMFMRGSLLVDWDALKARFEKLGTVGPSGGPGVEYTLYRPFETVIVFDPEHPERFILPEFPTDRVVDDGLHSVSKVLSRVVTPLLTGVVWFLLGFPVFGLLAGSRPSFLEDAHEAIVDWIVELIP